LLVKINFKADLYDGGGALEGEGLEVPRRQGQ